MHKAGTRHSFCTRSQLPGKTIVNTDTAPWSSLPSLDEAGSSVQLSASTGPPHSLTSYTLLLKLQCVNTPCSDCSSPNKKSPQDAWKSNCPKSTYLSHHTEKELQQDRDSVCTLHDPWAAGQGSQQLSEWNQPAGSKEATDKGVLPTTPLSSLPYSPQSLRALGRTHAGREGQAHLSPDERSYAFPSNPSAASQTWQAESNPHGSLLKQLPTCPGSLQKQIRHGEGTGMHSCRGDCERPPGRQLASQQDHRQPSQQMGERKT